MGNVGCGPAQVYDCISEYNIRDGLNAWMQYTTQSVIDRCVFRNNDDDGIETDNTGGKDNYFQFQNCISHDNGDDGMVVTDYPSGATYAPSVYHCTFVNNGGAGISFENSSSASYLTVKNVVSTGNTGDELYCEDHANFNLIHDYNCNDGSYGGKWSQAANDVTSNPLLVDPTSGDFNLRPSSPCVDAGIDVGIRNDYENNHRPMWNGYDIGADEYPGQSSGGIGGTMQ